MGDQGIVGEGLAPRSPAPVVVDAEADVIFPVVGAVQEVALFPLPATSRGSTAGCVEDGRKRVISKGAAEVKAAEGFEGFSSGSRKGRAPRP